MLLRYPSMNWDLWHLISTSISRHVSSFNSKYALGDSTFKTFLKFLKCKDFLIYQLISSNSILNLRSKTPIHCLKVRPLDSSTRKGFPLSGYVIQPGQWRHSLSIKNQLLHRPFNILWASLENISDFIRYSKHGRSEGGSLGWPKVVCFYTFWIKIVSFLRLFRQIVCFCFLFC